MDQFGEQAAILATTIVVTAVVLGALSLFLTSIAKPKGKDLEFFTSSAPGEALVAYKVVNACISDAQPNAFANFIFSKTGTDKAANITFELIRRMSGGLWVGGRVVLTTHRVIFAPNGMNRALHKQLSVIALNLADIVDIRDRFGVGTAIIDAVTPGGSLSFRCYGAKKFSETMRQTRTRIAA